MKYRRFFEPGGTFFFTVVTYERRNLFKQQKACDLFIKSLEHVQKRHTFNVIAYCICLDHIHMIWTLSESDRDYPTRWRLIKSFFSHHWKDMDGISVPESRRNKHERVIWQRRYWEHHIRDESDLKNHIEYIHYNPVKHGYVKSAFDWKLSSFEDYVSKGLYSMDWGTNVDMEYLEKYGSE